MEAQYLQLLYLISIFIGTFLISLSPFIRKKLGSWDHRYTILALISYVISIIVSVCLAALKPIQLEDPIHVMAAGFTVGLASKRLLEEIWKHVDPDWWKKKSDGEDNPDHARS